MDFTAIRQESREGVLSADVVSGLQEGSAQEIEHLMLGLIPVAAERSMPNLSGYKVGAVGQGESGCFYFGANFEMLGGPLAFTVHAEQSVVMNALKHHETGLKHLAISAAPCGVCRQFLYELADAADLSIVLADKEPLRLLDVLPGAFGPADLGLVGGLMKSELISLAPLEDNENGLVKEAYTAAMHSYAPYTGSAAGIALRLVDDSVHFGYTIENAAFNPALFPLQFALSMMALSSHDPSDIKDVVQVEVDGSAVSYVPFTEELLGRMAPECSFKNLVISRTA
ncbi:MAG: cytidine deaminase [gamma proteobacterium symbiont of Ctena orbiculata]|nr:MAG: cytidine deaminase [gamma proteobacterium symbiont of Ctena orbiculata]